MPENSLKTKIEAVRRNGGEIVFCQPNQQDREKGLADLVAKGCIPIPPYDHRDTICGQGITDAMALVWQHFRMLIETSSATVIAAILASLEDFAGLRVGAIISGGNVDLECLPFKEA